MSQSSVQEQPATADHRYRRLTPFWKWVLVSGTVLSLVISVYQLFNLGRFGGFVAIDTQYFYALLAVLLPMVFLIFPANSKTGATVPIYDRARVAPGTTLAGPLVLTEPESTLIVAYPSTVSILASGTVHVALEDKS